MERKLPANSGVPVERVRGEHPADESWRADALARSRHSRLVDEIREPLEDHRPDHAKRLCAEICRNALGDFAPALILLPAANRRRAQPLAAYSLTLFDFALQPGLEGERLAQINRWEFNLEQALSGNPPGQPAFVSMATEHRIHEWSAEILDRLATVARRRAVGKPALPGHDAELVGVLFQALSDRPPTPDVVALGSALLQLRRIQMASRLPQPTAREEGDSAWARRHAQLSRIEADLDRLRLDGIPPTWRRAFRFLRDAGRRLARTLEATGSEPEYQPHLGLASRVSLLLRARLSR